MFVLSGVSRQPILKSDLSFTPNGNVEVLMEALQIKNWTRLGTGVETLRGSNWPDLIFCLGMERPNCSVRIRNHDILPETD